MDSFNWESGLTVALTVKPDFVCGVLAKTK